MRCWPDSSFAASGVERGEFGFQILAFFLAQRLLERAFDPLHPPGDDFQVGQQKILVEASQFDQRIAAAERPDDQDQPANVADHAELRGVAFVRAAEAGRVNQFQRGPRDFLRMVNVAKLIDARIGHGGHGALPDVRRRRIGLDAGEPFEERTFSGALIADDADFHGEGSDVIVERNPGAHLANASG